MRLDRITIEMAEQQIRDVTYTTLPDGRTTICQLTLKSGFTVLGKSSCVAVVNYNPEIGQGVSYGDALDRLLELEAYRLMHEAAQ